MKKEMTSAEKCRRTKLSSKTNNELIEIIVRKDDVERRKDKLISCLKSNVAGLEKKAETLNISIANTESEFSAIKEDNLKLTTDNDKFKNTINVLKDDINRYTNVIGELNVQLRKSLIADVKCFAIGVAIGTIVGLVVAKFIF